MVRRPAALLGLPAAALAYLVVAPLLPALERGEAQTLVAGSLGLVAVAATALSILPARDTVVGPLLIVGGAGLLVAALNVAGVGAAASVPEALLAAAVGLLFARFLGTPAVAVAVPVFVAAIDLVGVLSGPQSRLLDAGGGVGGDDISALTFALPAWGREGELAARLALSDAVFLTMFAAWAWRFGLRRTVTAVALVAGLVGALVLGVVLDHAVPALPLLAAAYVLPNLDRIGALFRTRAGG